MLWKMHVLALMTLAFVPALARSADAKKEKVFRAGAATSNITPWLGSPIVGGWESPPAKHIHDELHARCLVLDDGSTRIVMVLVDSVGVSREVFDAAKKLINEHTGVPVDHMLMAATHTHSATSARFKNALIPDSDFSDYQSFLAHRIADGVRRAINNLEPARIAWGAAEEPRQVFNRRWYLDPSIAITSPFGNRDKVKMNPGSTGLVEPAGPTDPQISFLSLVSKEGRPIALLANYSLHYVGGVGSNHISADYYGAFADRIQELIGADRSDPPFVGIMSNGTSGDVNNIDFKGKSRQRMEPYEKIRLVADQVATAVYEQYQKLEYRDWVPLSMCQREIALGVRKPSADQVARARELMAGAEPKPERPHEKTYAERILNLVDAPPTVNVILQAVKIGELGIAAIPFEVFAEIGLEIKEKSPLKPTFTIELANGSYGYLPSPRQHALGGYETWLGSNRVEIKASDKMVDALMAMFAELKAQ